MWTCWMGFCYAISVHASVHAYARLVGHRGFFRKHPVRCFPCRLLSFSELQACDMLKERCRGQGTPFIHTRFFSPVSHCGFAPGLRHSRYVGVVLAFKYFYVLNVCMTFTIFCSNENDLHYFRGTVSLNAK